MGVSDCADRLPKVVSRGTRMRWAQVGENRGVPRNLASVIATRQLPVSYHWSPDPAASTRVMPAFTGPRRQLLVR